jgi:hypothetical protein
MEVRGSRKTPAALRPVPKYYEAVCGPRTVPEDLENRKILTPVWIPEMLHKYLADLKKRLRLRDPV